MSARDVFEAAGKNDEIALEVVDYVAKHLGLVLGNLASSLNPSKIVLGGGVSRAGELLRSKVEKTFRKCAFRGQPKRLIFQLQHLEMMLALSAALGSLKMNG